MQLTLKKMTVVQRNGEKPSSLHNASREGRRCARGRRSMSKRSRPEVMHEQITAHRQGISCFLRLGAENIAVKQTQVAPLVQSRADFVQHLALDQAYIQ